MVGVVGALQILGAAVLLSAGGIISIGSSILIFSHILRLAVKVRTCLLKYMSEGRVMSRNEMG